MTARSCAPVSDSSWQTGTALHAGDPAHHAGASARTGATIQPTANAQIARGIPGSESVAFRLAELLSEIAQVCQQAAEIQLDVARGLALMDGVPNRGDGMNKHASVPGRGEPLLTVHDLAIRFGVGAKTIRAWRTAGKLPPAIVLGGVVRWERKALESWLAERSEARS